MLLGLVAGNETGLQGIAVYILVYTLTNLGALLVVAALRRKNPGSLREDDLSDLSGLARHNPAYAALMVIFLVSLAGLPPTAGFIGKYYIFLALIETGHPILAVIATLYVAVAVFYYFASGENLCIMGIAEQAQIHRLQPRSTSRTVVHRRRDPGNRNLSRGSIPAFRGNLACFR